MQFMEISKAYCSNAVVARKKDIAYELVCSGAMVDSI